LDRPRRRSSFLILTALGAVAAAPAGFPLHGLRWVAPGADGARILTERPVECLGAPKSVDEAYLVEVGRAAFRTPLILGGAAARGGVECETCHRNGRSNPDFDLPGLSGAPGTADVRSFLFSPKRGDHMGKPRPIPDLGGPKSALKVSQAPGSPDLERFIHGLVTEEFDGAEPPPAVLAGLAAYVRALMPTACPAGGSVPVSVQADTDNARRAVRTGLAALAKGDPATAMVMIGAARSVLGDVAERYAVPGLEIDIESLSVADLGLAAAVSDIRRGDPSARLSLETWLARSDVWSKALQADERRSYYDRAILAQAIGSSETGARLAR
jgi:hypothetical protein